MQETVIRIKNHSIEEATKKLDPTDIKGLQQLMNAKGNYRTFKNCIFLLIKDKI